MNRALSTRIQWKGKLRRILVMLSLTGTRIPILLDIAVEAAIWIVAK